MEDILQGVRQATTEAVVNELYSYNLLAVNVTEALYRLGNPSKINNNLIDIAMDNTINDIKRYNIYVKKLNTGNKSILQDIDTLADIIKVQDALKSLKGATEERDFVMFFNRYFRNQTNRYIALSMEVDLRTVNKIRRNVLRKLSLFLYPDMHLQELMK